MRNYFLASDELCGSFPRNTSKTNSNEGGYINDWFNTRQTTSSSGKCFDDVWPIVKNQNEFFLFFLQLYLQKKQTLIELREREPLAYVPNNAEAINRLDSYIIHII